MILIKKCSTAAAATANDPLSPPVILPPQSKQQDCPDAPSPLVDILMKLVWEEHGSSASLLTGKGESERLLSPSNDNYNEQNEAAADDPGKSSPAATPFQNNGNYYTYRDIFALRYLDGYQIMKKFAALFHVWRFWPRRVHCTDWFC